MTPSTPEPISPSTSIKSIPSATLRREYRGSLAEADLAVDWSSQFGRWLADAVDAGLMEPNAAVLATADPDGVPSARVVLLKRYDPDGFVFFTNHHSGKGREVLANPRAALVLDWHAIHRQVVVSGTVEQVSRAETDEYFATRPRAARIGAWASPQSAVIGSREELDRAWRHASDRFGDDGPVPAPEHWGGFRVRPATVEFWQGRANRLHDRLRFRSVGDRWVVERLAP